jgi:hypothetical protein
MSGLRWYRVYSSPTAHAARRQNVSAAVRGMRRPGTNAKDGQMTAGAIRRSLLGVNAMKVMVSRYEPRL